MTRYFLSLNEAINSKRLAISLVLTMILCAAAVVCLFVLPSQIAVQWNLAGEVTNVMPRGAGVICMASVGLFGVTLLRFGLHVPGRRLSVQPIWSLASIMLSLAGISGLVLFLIMNL